MHPVRWQPFALIDLYLSILSLQPGSSFRCFRQEFS